MSKREKVNVVSMHMTAPRLAAPDVVGEGRVECPCGLFSFGPWKGTPGMSAMACCPHCGRWLEALVGGSPDE